MWRSMVLFGVACFGTCFTGLGFSQEVSPVPPGTPVKLPAFAVHPKWQQAFPPDHPFFVEKYPDGTVQGIHARHLARLNGPSVTFHENGKLKSLAYYPDGVRQGTGYLWNEEQELAACFQSKAGKANGVACLFKGDEPYLVQKWTDGKLDKETLVSHKYDAIVAVEGGEQLAAAHEKLAGLWDEFAASEKELIVHLRESARAVTDQLDQAKIHAARVTSSERLKADVQRSRQQADALTAAEHTHPRAYGWSYKDRVGRVAGADERFATQDAKAAKQKAEAATAAERQKLNALASSLDGEAKENYVAALTALEIALPSQDSDNPSASAAAASPSAAAATAKKVFVVHWREGKKGHSHIDEIIADAAEDAKAQIRQKHPHAQFSSVESK